MGKKKGTSAIHMSSKGKAALSIKPMGSGKKKKKKGAGER